MKLQGTVLQLIRLTTGSERIRSGSLQMLSHLQTVWSLVRRRVGVTRRLTRLQTICLRSCVLCHSLLNDQYLNHFGSDRIGSDRIGKM